MEKNKKKIILKAIKKRLKLRYIILLIVLLASNTFAWFIYSQQVEGALDVHVKAWKVIFQTGDTEVSSYVNIDVDSAYPGMDTFTKSLTAYNKSEVATKITYTILYANFMGDILYTREGKVEYGLELSDDDITSEQFLASLESVYPFKITMGVDKEQMEPLTGDATYSVNVEWPYESGNDELDTKFGSIAYDYLEKNPGKPCISLRVLVKIEQVE